MRQVEIINNPINPINQIKIKIEKYERFYINQFQYFNEALSVKNQQLLNQFKRDFEDKDQEIKSSGWRKEQGWLVHDKVNRTLITEFGEIKFYRTLYKNKYTKEHKFLVDPYLQIQKWAKVSFSLKYKIIQLVEGGERQKDILKMIPSANLTQSTISNLFRQRLWKKDYIEKQMELKIEKNRFEKLTEKFQTNENIYIDIDDTFPTVVRYGKKITLRTRIATMRLGSKEGVQLHKRHFIEFYSPTTKTNTEEYSKRLIREIEFHYGSLENKRLIVNGDGASWIKNIASFIGAKFTLDKFHLYAMVYKTFAYKLKTRSMKSLKEKHYYNEIIFKLKNSNAENVIEYLISILDGAHEKSIKIKKLINYIKNNIAGINNWSMKWYNGCFAESQVSHVVKSILGYGAKIYSYTTFINLILLKVSKQNGIDFMSEIRNNELTRFEWDIEDGENAKFRKYGKTYTRSSELEEHSILALNGKTTIAKWEFENMYYGTLGYRKKNNND